MGERERDMIQKHGEGGLGGAPTVCAAVGCDGGCAASPSVERWRRTRWLCPVGMPTFVHACVWVKRSKLLGDDTRRDRAIMRCCDEGCNLLYLRH